MPLRHTRSFRVRHYECDAFSWLAPSVYLRYMQEAAFDASSAAGYPFCRYHAMGRIWLIRETDIRFVSGARYNDCVNVTTWVADFQRVRSRRAYEFRRGVSGDLVALARTDWAFLDSSSGRPARIPAELAAAFIPEGAREAPEPRGHLPAVPPPSRAFRTSRLAEWADLDPGRHVNNARFLSLVEECAVHAASAGGWGPDRWFAANLRMAATRHQIEYLRPGLFGDQLQLAAWFEGGGDEAIISHCTIARSGSDEVLVRARSEWSVCRADSAEQVPLPSGISGDLCLNA